MLLSFAASLAPAHSLAHPACSPARRRHERGLALFEGVIVCLTLISFLALGTCIYRRHVERITAARQARQAAWSHALDGCRSRTDFEGLLANAMRDGRRPRAERFVLDSALGSATGAGSGSAVPCLEPLGGLDVSRLGAELERHLLPSSF